MDLLNPVTPQGVRHIHKLIDSCHLYVDPDQDLKPIGFHSMR